jgi:hypothetical protein
MRSLGLAIAALFLIGSPGTIVRGQQDPCDRIVIWPLPAPPQPECEERRVPRRVRAEPSRMSVRPEMLAYQIDTIAGRLVQVPYARVVGVFEPSVFLIDGQKELPPISGHRARVLVFTSGSVLRVAPATLVGATVTISGTARTLLGMQVTVESGWPKKLTPDEVKHLEIKAAILAESVKTPEGIELTAMSSQSKESKEEEGSKEKKPKF